jgi:hypothetical protein
VFSESVILSGYYYDHILKSWIGGSFTTKLCWRATRDGWAASTFHSNCNYKKPTVTLVKVGNYTFGGYATESWEGRTIIISDVPSFLSNPCISFRYKDHAVKVSSWNSVYLKKGSYTRTYMKSNRYILTKLSFCKLLYQNMFWHHIFFHRHSRTNEF